MGKWQQVSSKVVHKNPYYFVREDEVITPTGEPGKFYVIDGRTPVFVVAITNEGKILLESIYRYPTQQDSLEIMAGGIDPGEDPLTAAKRELQEETGFTADNWEKIGTLQSIAGIGAIMNHFYICSSLHKTDINAQAEEGITSVKAYSKQEVLDMIISGKLNCQGTIAGIMLAIVHGKI